MEEHSGTYPWEKSGKLKYALHVLAFLYAKERPDLDDFDAFLESFMNMFGIEDISDVTYIRKAWENAQEKEE